ncbi:MAG: hypothetical protein VX619_04755 [bacterium]|nr:hypothetical protein [bacterium]
MMSNKVIYGADPYLCMGSGDLLSLIYLSKRMERLGIENHFICLDTSSARLLIEEMIELKFFNTFGIDFNIEQFVKEFHHEVVSKCY